MDTPVEVKLELELEEGAPVGRILQGDSATEFSGWLGLMSVLDSILDEGVPGSGREHQRQGSAAR
jgi:hypothetical protein